MSRVHHLPVPTREPFVDKWAVADFLGKSVSWVEKRSSDRSLPSHKIGANRRYRLSEVSSWVEKGAA